MSNNIVDEPWLSFLKEIDDSLESEVSFHCFGAFAITVQLGLPRQTADVDILSAVVRDQYQTLLELAGKESPLHKKHRVYLDLVGAIASVADDYEERLIHVTTPLKRIRLYVMEVHDIVLTKLSRNQPKDIQDVEYIAKTVGLDTDLLGRRYESELRHNIIGPPERADGTLAFWLQMIKDLQTPSA